MGYVIAFVCGHEFRVCEADVYDTMRALGCGYDDALWHIGYEAYLELEEA